MDSPMHQCRGWLTDILLEIALYISPPGEREDLWQTLIPYFQRRAYECSSRNVARQRTKQRDGQ